jgi:predicted  nucleic acid-binding Zn-ribbon protein
VVFALAAIRHTAVDMPSGCGNCGWRKFLNDQHAANLNFSAVNDL